jgi:hypothetical protein
MLTSDFDSVLFGARCQALGASVPDSQQHTETQARYKQLGDDSRLWDIHY